MQALGRMKSIETMERITRQKFCDNFDEILDRVDKEDIGFVILNNEGKDGHVLCPARWFQINFSDDLGCIINSALRYAIHRHTYMELDLEGCSAQDMRILHKYGKVEKSISRDIIVPADITLHALHYGLLTQTGIKVEVKSSAYLQTWHQRRPSELRFSIAPTLAWDKESNSYASEKRDNLMSMFFAYSQRKIKNPQILWI